LEPLLVQEARGAAVLAQKVIKAEPQGQRTQAVAAVVLAVIRQTLVATAALV
jgi:hypothetical protein